MLTKVREQCMNKVRLSTKRKNIRKYQMELTEMKNIITKAEKSVGGVQQQTRLSETKT